MAMRYGSWSIPKQFLYAKSHLWVKKEDGLWILGWTDYIQSNAGEVTYIILPSVGTRLKVNQEFASIETAKWIDKIYSPLEGRVIETNGKLIENPRLINESPFEQGWFVRIREEGRHRQQSLMSAQEYEEFLKTCEKRYKERM